MKSRNISILGSTGSIGQNTLRVVDHLGDVSVVALAAGRNMKVLAEQVIKYEPKLVACGDENAAAELETILSDSPVKLQKPPRILTGEGGLVEVAQIEDADTVVSATVGAVGFVPTLRAIECGKRIALANKETLVIAGELMTKAAADSGAEILPVDSEHNALHQCLRGEKKVEVNRLILTASGGPFRSKSADAIRNATVEEALAHPTWDMGDKISIDSATLMNKGLEVIEAHWLFGFEGDQIEVLVHPQSVVHSMIELIDGSVIAQLGVTDMKHAIQYALTYPDRKQTCLKALDFADISRLDFEKPDFERFPNLQLAFEALKKGGTAPAVLNASNEVAVQAFLDRRIRLDEIARINGEMLERHSPVRIESLDTVTGTDRQARIDASEMISKSFSAVPSGNPV